LLHEPFQRLVQQEQLLAYKYDGFWAAMDTFKDKQMLDDIYASGRAPWQVWNHINHQSDRRVAQPRPRIASSRAAARQ
jgi:glucose-1-phosphate cytidylyltransferase